MLTGSQFDDLTIPITDLYEDYHQTVINDIARRLKKLGGSVSSTARWQLQRLIESGKLYETALKEIAVITGQSEQELKQIFKEAGVESMKFDDNIYRQVGLTPGPLSPAMLSALQAGVLKTNGNLRNMTLTTALDAQNKFNDAANLAYQQVLSGTFSYDEAIRQGIKQLAAEGLSTVGFASGRTDQIDVAVRRAVLTGIGQTTGRLQEMRMDELGVDLVQVSEHGGARPTHRVWQGKVFDRSGKSRKYPDFVTSTGYGTAGGLSGVNCRHSFYPFFPGTSKTAYEEASINEQDEKRVTYNGKKYNVYDANQIQRGLERGIRKSKREASALGAAELDNSKELARIHELQAKLRDFTKQTGLQRHYVREGGKIIKRTIIPNKTALSVVEEMRTWTPEQRKAIADRLRLGKEAKRKALSGTVDPPNVGAGGRTWTPEQRKEIAERLRKGKEAKRIALAEGAPKAMPEKKVANIKTPKPDVPKSVSSALKVLKSGEKVRDDILEATHAIDSVHKDGNLPTATIGLAHKEGNTQGTYRAFFRKAKSGKFLPQVELSDNAVVYSTNRQSTIIHELGHFLDHHGLSDGLAFASDAAESNILKGWWDAVEKSQTYRRLVRIKDMPGQDKTYMEYFTKRRELFARSYTQYIMRNSGNDNLKDLLRRKQQRQVNISEVWPDDEFAPIEIAFDKIFQQLGWLV